ncbi:MAG: hypothetical protein JJT81_04075 [Rubellimicrobium sp.]|nr:hypothetical protein [Rubellimicrobium sp.]
MIVKIVTFFLIAMAVMAMFGRLRLPGRTRLEARKCASCGRYRFGKGPCRCRKDLN